MSCLSNARNVLSREYLMLLFLTFIRRTEYKLWVEIFIDLCLLSFVIAHWLSLN